MSISTANSTLDRTKPPVPGPMRAVHFPTIDERMLSNGLSVYIVEAHDQPIASVMCYFRTGSTNDPVELPGLASMTSGMLTKGTLSRSAMQIADEIDFVGGSLHSNASWDASTVSIGVLSKFLSTGLDLLEDVLLHPSFPVEELDRLKLQRLAALTQSKAEAGYLADNLFARLVFPDHPYGSDANGTERSIAEISTEAVRQFYHTHYGPEQAFIIAAGDIDPATFIPELESRFGAWKPHTTAKQSYVTQPRVRGIRVALVERDQAVQSALRVGHLGIRRDNPDFIALHVLNMLFGGYFNSRINLNLREKHGFTYGARSQFDTRLMPGPFAVSTEVSTGVTLRAVEEILSELRRITVEMITEEELEMVKNYVIGSFPLQIETPQQIASRMATLILYGLPRNYYDTYRERVAALTREELLRVAREYLHPDDALVVVSGNVDAIRSGLEEIGPVSIYDREGNLIESVAA